MGKKKIIGFVMGIAMTCAATSVVSACNLIGGSSGTNSSSSSSVQTPASVEYKVTFDAMGGSSVKAQYITKGETAQKPAENPTREGYTFVEWQLNGNAYDFNTAVVGDITLKAKWEKNAPTKFAVSFMVEGESTPFYTAEVATGKKVMKPADVPTREGYAFDCWTLNGVEFDFETPVTQELTLVAKWDNVWTITYDAGEETPFHTAEVVDGATTTAPTEVPTREGYVFDYWTLNGVEFDFETPVTQAFTLVAKWANAWMVTFDVGEGTPIDPAMVKDGGTVSAPDAKREGYYVTDWLLNGETFDFTTPITEDITLTAVWDTDGLYSNQIGIRICGNDVSGQSQWMNKETDDKGATVITAKFQADATYSPALVLREVFSKEYYQGLIELGYTSITFNLAIEGDITDLYIFGKPITSFVKNNGVYAVVVSLQHIVNHYDTIYTLATSANQAGQATSLSAKFLSWKSPANDYTSTKNYIFTISDIAVSDTFFEFAEDSTATIYTGETTTLEVNTNVIGDVVWSSSDATIATVEDGVVTGLKAGEVTITATLNGLTASKTVKVNYRNQIGARINGNDVTANPNYLQVTTDETGTTVITAKFQADATYSPALILRALAEKAVYESLIAEGKTSLTFNLAIEGDITDLYIFGKPITSFVKNNGVYAVVVSLQRIVEYYETIKTLATSANQAGQASSMPAKFITWKSPAEDWSTVRDYVFTISEVVLDDTAEPTFSVEFAEGSTATIYTGETTTLEVNTNVTGDVVWSSSDATIATVEDGVVTGLKAGEVTITATLNGLTASKTVKVNYRNQIGARINGNDVTANPNYLQVTTDETGTTVITTKFQADATYSPALILRALAEKAVYESLIAEGKTSLTFNLAVKGDVSDLYVFGKALNTFPEIDGVYAVVVRLQRIVEYYETIKTLATSANQAGQASSMPAKFITWKSPAEDYASVRNYVFTITDVVIGDTAEPTFSVEFAEGNAATIYTGETTTLEVNTNVIGDVVWSSSNNEVATVENGVVTGLKAGEVTITATLNGLTASKTVEVIYHNQIGARINGNDVTANPNYLQVTTDETGTTVITTKFQADATYSPALILRALAEKAVYESLIAEGKTSLTFNLAVEGDVSDLYVFGKALNTFPEIDGVYAVVVSLQRIVEYYDTIKALATSANQAGQASSMPAKFITWKSPAEDYASVRNYVFTITDVVIGDTAEPTFSVEFAEGSAATIYTGETTTLEVNTNVIGDVVWSSSDATIATVEDGVVTGLKAGEVTITATLNGLTASKTVKVNYRNQIGVHAYGWDQTGNATYFNMSNSDNGETIIAVQFAGSTTHYPSLTLKEMYNQEYCQALIADGYAKLTFNLKVGGTSAADVSDLYVFGKKLVNFAKTADGVYAVVVDLQFMVDNYDKVSGMGTSVEAKNAEFEYMFLAWKSADWTKRNYEFTFSNVSLRKGALFSDNIGMRVNGWNMTTNTTYMQMDVAADGAMTITANWQAYANYGPALVLKNMQSKEYYQGLIDSGYTHLTFDLQVGGADADKLDDIHILGSAQKVSACEQVNGVYKVQIQLAHIVQFYDTIVTLDTSGNQAGQWGSRSALLLAWRFSTNFATVPEDATRNYVFTISNTAFSKVN